MAWAVVRDRGGARPRISSVSRPATRAVRPGRDFARVSHRPVSEGPGGVAGKSACRCTIRHRPSSQRNRCVTRSDASRILGCYRTVLRCVRCQPSTRCGGQCLQPGSRRQASPRRSGRRPSQGAAGPRSSPTRRCPSRRRSSHRPRATTGSCTARRRLGRIAAGRRGAG